MKNAKSRRAKREGLGVTEQNTISSSIERKSIRNLNNAYCEIYRFRFVYVTQSSIKLDFIFTKKKFINKNTIPSFASKKTPNGRLISDLLDGAKNKFPINVAISKGEYLTH